MLAASIGLAAILAITVLDDLPTLRALAYALPLAAVLYVALDGGVLLAWVGALLASAYAGVHFVALDDGPLFDELVLWGGISVVTFGVALLAGAFVRREERATRALLKAIEERAASQGAEFGIGRLFQSVGEAVVVADATGRIVLWNPAAERIFGYTREEAAKLNVRALVPEELRPAHDEGIGRYRETGVGAYIDTHKVMELPALHKDGHRLMIEMTLSRVDHVASTQGPFALAMLRDVTEKVRLRGESEASNKAMREANEALEAFTYVTSHDLKEPVRALESFALALKEDHAALLATDAEARELVDRIYANTTRLRNLIEGLLEYSRATRIAASELEPIRVEEAITASDCRARFEHILAERNARLIVEPGPAVRASPTGLCQILGNLVLNSLKHHPSPKTAVRIWSATWTEDPEFVEVCVEDNGPGFPPHVLKAFGRVRGDRPSSIRGGFGLLITRQAVEKMGGRMWLRNLPQGGAAAHFVLHGATSPRSATGEAAAPEGRAADQ